MPGLTSAAGVVGFLQEPDPELQIFALHTLDDQIDSLWTEVADCIEDIEALYEDTSFPERELAALVAAKVYYHLGEYNESMVFALHAGTQFDLGRKGEFEDTIISKCIDTYIAIYGATSSAEGRLPTPQVSSSFPSKSNGASSISASLTSPITPFSQSALPPRSLLSRQDSTTTFDPSLQGMENANDGVPLPGSSTSQHELQKQLQNAMEQLFEDCFRQGRFTQVVGIAVEARQLEWLRTAMKRAIQADRNDGFEKHTPRGKSLLDYMLSICMDIVQENALRSELLRIILDLLNELHDPDYFAIAKCVVYLDEYNMASKLLIKLVEKADAKSVAIAYQIAFDLYDNSTQQFLRSVQEGLSEESQVQTSESARETQGTGHAPNQSEQTLKEIPSEAKSQENGHAPEESQPLLSELQDHAAPASSIDGPAQPQMSPEAEKAFNAIKDILKGSKSIELDLEFLYRSNKTDMSILNKIKDSLEARNSIFHSAVTFANAFMHAGTTNDKFFRDNLEWLGKAVNWSKFTATAALGVIHRGNLGQGQKLLEPYLPKDQIAGANTGSVYSQGGSLYALGLIYANHETLALDLIRDHFKKATEEVVQHGAALGLGCAGMANQDDGIFEDLKAVLYADSALNGEAVGIAMGLIKLGSGHSKSIEDMIAYAHDTQHEKIVRGLSLGMALIMYSRQEAADSLVNGLLQDPDPLLRYGGIQTLALAYCGTGSNKAIRKLLHVAVSDVDDNVRRVAVMSLGFILFRKPSSVPRMVELLSESYNPHVRYGAAMALGISCAGTGLDEAIDLLEPMIKDPTDFVRQGAFVALSMILVQQNEAMNPKVTSIRKTLQKAISDRHEDAMTKFGSAVAQGIIDAGGRNCTISLQTQTGNLNMAAVVGMAVFTQYWYWFPLTHFLTLSFTPTHVIGLDQDLEVPQIQFHSATRPSLFDYPPEQETKTEDAPEKVKTAVLSTTAQAKRRAQRKEKLQHRDSMDVDQTPTTPKVSTDDKMETDEPTPATKDAEAEKKDATAEKEETGEDAEKKPITDTTGSPAPEKSAAKKRLEKEKVGVYLDNMSRVLPPQRRYISLQNERYNVIKAPRGGVVLLIDSKPEEPKSLVEMKAKKPVKPAAAPGQTTDGPAEAAPTTDGANAGGQEVQMEDVTGGGAAAGAGVLTAVDEGEEGEEDAEVPGEFEYFSDNEDASKE